MILNDVTHESWYSMVLVGLLIKFCISIIIYMCLYLCNKSIKLYSMIKNSNSSLMILLLFWGLERFSACPTLLWLKARARIAQNGCPYTNQKTKRLRGVEEAPTRAAPFQPINLVFIPTLSLNAKVRAIATSAFNFNLIQ